MPPKTEKAEKVEKAAAEPKSTSGASNRDHKATATRDRELEAALSSITKAYGDGAIMRLGDAFQAKVEVIPTGALALDLALGVGGLPRGRVIEIYGP